MEIWQNPLWLFGSNNEVREKIDFLLDATPRRYRVTFPGKSSQVDRPPIQDYCDELDAFDETGTLRAKYRCDGYPTVLQIDDPTFTYDYFQQSGAFVSEAFRDTLGLPANSVEFVALDDSHCPPELRAKKYMVMRIIAFRDVIDIQNTLGLANERPYFRAWKPGDRLEFTFKDVEVDVPLFYDFRFHRPFATDAFAERVLRTNLTGFSFFAPNIHGRPHKIYSKTLDDENMPGFRWQYGGHPHCPERFRD